MSKKQATFIPAAAIIDAGISMLRSGDEYAAMLAAEIPRLSKATQPQRDKWAFALVQGVIQQAYPGVAVAERSMPQPNAYPWEIVCEDDDKRKAVAKRVSLLLKPLKEGEVSISGMRAAGAGRKADAQGDPVARYLHTITNDAKLSWDDVRRLAEQLIEAADAAE